MKYALSNCKAVKQNKRHDKRETFYTFYKVLYNVLYFYEDCNSKSFSYIQEYENVAYISDYKLYFSYFNS